MWQEAENYFRIIATNVKNKRSIMENVEKQIVKIIKNNSPELAAEKILRLLGVVGRSEQLVCECKDEWIIHIDNFSDRMQCKKCGKSY